MKYAITWDLDSLFEGGIDSTELSTRLILLDDQIKDYARLVGKWDTERDTPDFLFLDSILALQELVSNGFGQTISFVNAIQSADVNNKKVPGHPRFWPHPPRPCCPPESRLRWRRPRHGARSAGPWR